MPPAYAKPQPAVAVQVVPPVRLPAPRPLVVAVAQVTAYNPPLSLLLSVLSCTDRHPLPEEGAGMVYVPADTDLIHDPRDDCSERRRVTDLEREALDLLGLPTSAAWERHSISEWARVDRLAGVLAELRRPFVPVPRPAADWRAIPVVGGATR